MTENLYWILKADIGAGNLDGVTTFAAKASEMTSQEKGTLIYEWSVNEAGTKLHIFERFASPDAALEHLGNIGEHMPELMGLVNITEIDCYGTTTETFREAVKDFPVTYHKQIGGFAK